MRCLFLMEREKWANIERQSREKRTSSDLIMDRIKMSEMNFRPEEGVKPTWSSDMTWSGGCFCAPWNFHGLFVDHPLLEKVTTLPSGPSRRSSRRVSFRDGNNKAARIGSKEVWKLRTKKWARNCHKECRLFQALFFTQLMSTKWFATWLARHSACSSFELFGVRNNFFSTKFNQI